MSKFVLAQLNIARMKTPLESPLLAEFVASLDRINELAERSPGYRWRLRRHGPTVHAFTFRNPFPAADEVVPSAASMAP